MRNLTVFLIVLTLLFSGCQTDYEEKLPDELADILGLKIDRPLEVAFVSPQGEASSTDLPQSVTVVFNQPMKILSSKNAPVAQPFTLEPKVDGRFRWKGAATVSFEPSEPFDFGRTYTVTVPSGLTSLSDNELASNYSTTFDTPAPVVVESFPEDGADSHPAGNPLFIVFNQPVEPAAVERLLSYSTPSGSLAPKARHVTEEELESLNSKRSEEKEPLLIEQTVAILTDDLKHSTTYTLKLDRGLVGLAGPLSSNDPTLLTFTTLSPFQWSAPQQSKPQAPEDSILFEFNNSVNSAALKEHIEVSPSVTIPVHDYDKGDDWNRHYYYLDLEPNTTYTFTIKKGLEDIHGQALESDLTFTVETQDRKPLAYAPEGIAVLEASDTLTLPVGLRNIDKLTYRMVRLERNELVKQLISESDSWLWGNDSTWNGPQFSVTETLTPEGPKNEIYTYEFDIKKALKGRKFGFVYYQLELQSQGETLHRRGLIQVTNLAATGKFSPENSLFMATSLDKAKPLESVEATVLDPKGRPIWQGKTKQDGLTEAPGWSALLGKLPDGTYSPDLLAFLKLGDDETFVSSDGFGRVNIWPFNVDFRWNASEHYLNAQVYTDRGLYKPGDKVELKGSLRDRRAGRWALPDLAMVDFTVYDSRDREIDKGKVSISEFGTFHHTITLAEGSPTGSYRVDYELNPDTAEKWGIGKWLTGAHFRVEEFEPAAFEVTVESRQDALSVGDKATFTVQADWLFGAPISDAEVHWTALIEPAVYEHEDYPEYDFGPRPNFDEDADTTKTISSGTETTGADGETSTTVTLDAVPFRGDADLIFEGTVTSSNRRSVTGYHVIPVARGTHRIGLKPSSRFLAANTDNSVELITLDTDGKLSSGKKITVELVRQEWSSVKKTDVDGRFRWVTEVEEKVLNSSEVVSKTKPVTFSVTPPEAGSYLIRARSTDDRDNPIISESSFYVYGSGYVPWARGDGDSIELVADKPRYAPGDTAKIMIQSPFEEATALITYERDLIIESQVMTLEGSAPMIEVAIGEEHLPNLYVSVILQRGRTHASSPDEPDDPGKPSFKFGLIDLPVSSESQRLNVELTTDDKRYGPNSEVITKIKVTDDKGNPVEAELSLAAADVGVLNLIDFKTPDLFDTYHSSIPLAVRTAESRLEVIGQRSYGTKGEAAGGGGGYNSSFRKDFKLTALWEPEIVTDSNGEAEVRFNLPENLTTFRLMATAITKDTRCGSADTEIILTKPLILQPSTPAFARVDDQFEAGVLAYNGSGKGVTVKLALDAIGIEVEDKTDREFFLKDGEEREILFAFTPQTEGSALLRFSASTDEHEDGVEYEIPIKLSTQSVNLAHTGVLDEGKVELPVEVPQSALTGSAQLEVNLASSLLLGLQPSVEALLDYPYHCLEQRLARLTPLFSTKDLIEPYQLVDWDDNAVAEEVRSTLDFLPGYAGADGGLKVWPDSRLVHPLLTAEAVRIASIAQNHGYDVKGPWLNDARAYLKSYLDGKVADTYPFSPAEQMVIQSSALEALTRFELVGVSYLNRLVDKRQTMPTAGLSYLLATAHRTGEKATEDKLAQDLINSLTIENATAHFEVDSSSLPWIYSSPVRDTALALEALLETGHNFPGSDKVVTWLLDSRDESATWSTTANNAAVLRALVAYRHHSEALSPRFTVNIRLDNNELASESFDTPATKELNLADLSPGSQATVEVEKVGDGRLYYQVAARYQDTQASPPVDQGFTVLRNLTDLDDRPVARLRGGELYKVTLSVITPTLRHHVVCRDPLPAGLSVVKTDFDTESRQLRDLLDNSSQPSWQSFHRFENYADHVMLFADALAPGEHTYEYLVRAETPGTYLHPATQAEEMYHPELFGRTGETTVIVK